MSDLAKNTFPQDGEQAPLLKRLTTMEVGGRPALYRVVDEEQEAIALCRWARAEEIPIWVLGGGSNVLCDDEQLDGLVLQLIDRGIEWIEKPQQKRCEVILGAGVVWSDFVEEAVRRGLVGVECLIGIPGWAGAAPIQNIGAYGQSLSDTCEAVRVYDLHTDEVKWWSAQECSFGYRESIFKSSKGRYLITAVKLTLLIQAQPTINYPQLAEKLSESFQDRSPSLHDVMETVRTLRAQKSMLWRKEDPNHRSVGSFFVNPLISAQEGDQLVLRCGHLGLKSPPMWPHGDQIKVPAAWLIEQAGLSKGWGEGKVGLSSAHTLAIINRGGASYLDIINFASLVQRRVWQRFNIWLTPEAQLISSQATPYPLRFKPKVALVTCSNLPDWEVDDQPLWQELRTRSVELVTPAWDDQNFDWSSCDLVIPRTTWDYQGRWENFLAWMERVHQESTLLNPIELMRWNLDKRYLKDLRISQPQTEWIEQRTLENLKEAEQLAEQLCQRCKKLGWTRAFIKPHIGASAVGTLRFKTDLIEDQNRLAEHLLQWTPTHTLILQPYLQTVEKNGEFSAIFFSGEFSHGVQKIPVAGDYRVQDDYGASDRPWTAPDEWVECCGDLISRLPVMPLYARCDALQNEDGTFALVELELIEPSLFFRHDAQSPARFAEAILERIAAPHP